MESNPQQYESAQSNPVEGATSSVSVNLEQGGTLIKIPPKSSKNDQVMQEWLEPVASFLASMPDYVGSFVSDYQKPLITILLLLSGVVSVKVVLAVLDSINDIPLLSPLFELVGIIYSGWFVYRYLLKASTRQELVQDFRGLKNQVLGSKDN